MKRYFFALSAAIVTLFTQCDTIKNLPTNTSGGLFSLNGNWQLASSSDNKALEGTVVTVVPGYSNGTARTLANNTYCLREGDVVWKNLKSLQGGTFSLNSIVNSCNGTLSYTDGTITVLTNDEIRIATKSANNSDVLQTWRRVANPSGQ
ncbi:hypothetical protein [Flavisolibacter tropicus]|uniref:Lipocalin-like domain-containing protein n=1 Tax=Flavisolibacter tropicus TaxID=1492898 RepID=A0A172TRN9_9BACT|nr:hypothetical protein [Flavisolibacter tropicus]ANE49749.1 hypothetical protein SY85_03835 [Flavisolibacter tropicus]